MSSRKWLSLGLKVAVSVGLIALAAAAAWFLTRQSIRPKPPPIASQQTPALLKPAPTMESKPLVTSAPAAPTAVAVLPSPVLSATAEKPILELSSVPTGANIFQNGSIIGTTPIRRDDLVPGDTTLVLMKDGYLPREFKVALNTSGVFKQQVALAQAAPLYQGTIRVRNKNDAPGVPISIAWGWDLKSGTMTQTGRHGNFVVKFAGIWEGAELHATTRDIGIPLTITLASDRNSGTEIQTSKYGDTVVNFSGFWDGKTLRAVTGTVVSKPKNIQWKPESFAVSFAGDWRTATYDCTAEGQHFIAELSAQ